ncbi:MAG: 2-isopropylmalate synthase [Ruminiclostridium sp.]|nr:2-isopropylmalate synthase [Ruminiclostridium sp.]
MEVNGKYRRSYFMPPKREYKWTSREYVDKAPIWCSVDLRDGNQALVVPMSLEEKLEFFSLLVKLGFKEIEIGFPAASETEYEFCRKLIEGGLIPDDVKIQVLTQSREHIIRKTFEALEGAKNAIVHLYNSTSEAQREQVFRKSREEITEIAVSGAKLVKEYAEKTPGNFSFEYSPESFTGTEPDFALDICNAVLKIWEPAPDNKVIVNLPVTVELSMPHIYADQVEYMCDGLYRRENVIVSLHPHNDRGCAVADTEFGLLAGADRVEGTLFGNGERTGNVDIVTLALNMFSHGVDPKLDFTDIPSIVKIYEKVTCMHVYERQPYSGELVFAAFSGSHQDAIAKGMKYRENGIKRWNVPYLPIDPKDIGREYDGDIIRINSQSGKGGIGFLLEKKYGIALPPKLREIVGYAVKDVSDKQHRELAPSDVYDVFTGTFVNIFTPLKVTEVHYKQENGTITAAVTALMHGKKSVTDGHGNGRLDAVSDALMQLLGTQFTIMDYSEQALEQGSKSNAMSYLEIGINGGISWGVGVHSDIIMSSVYALVCAVNRGMKEQ